MSALLQIEGLHVALPAGADRPFAIEDVSLELRAGETLCIVGESGSGKSMIASTIMRLLPSSVRVTGGRVRLDGENLLLKSETEMQALRGRRVAMIFQEPMTALNPLRPIGDQIGEMFCIHTSLSSRQIGQRVLDLLREVQIPEPESASRAYPHELSGGQRQRAMIAMALALEPALLIADEPTTALDVTTQAQILKLIRSLQRRHGTAVLFITHDFGVVADIADRIAVMQHGRVVEAGPADGILNRPQHGYTRTLIAAVPPLAAALPTRQPRLAGPDVLRLEGISKTYGQGGGLFSRHGRVVHAVKQVSLSLPRGSTLGIVGESGSGKSTLARCILRLLEPDTGAIRLGGTDLAALSARELRKERHRVQMVFQDPYASLNPRRRVGDLVMQGPIVHGVPRKEALRRAQNLFGLVGLRADALDRFPHEFSGGQRQRIGLARALALQPDVLVADEAVSALDVSVQAQVLRLLAELRERLQLSIVFITHDLRVAAQICDRVAVMRRGEVVEQGTVAEVFGTPRDPYTRALIAALPGQGWTPPVLAATEDAAALAHSPA
jgi:peptide/nickel transport system ATP-binding protein